MQQRHLHPIHLRSSAPTLHFCLKATARAGALAAAVMAIVSCQAGTPRDSVEREASDTAKAPASKKVVEAPAPAKGGEAPHAGCGCADPSSAKSTTTTTKVAADGSLVQAAGKPLEGAKQVKVADLLTAPERFAGQRVSVEGSVSSMCTHRRAWFAVNDGGVVRVITSPSFLVPENAVGKKARAEGTVEVVELPEAAARHLAEETGFADPATINGPVKQAIVRATGAEFI